MYDEQRVEEVLNIVREGRSLASVSRSTGISRAAIREWIRNGPPRGNRHAGQEDAEHCFICSANAQRLPAGPYAYLLGLYLGDGCISRQPKGGPRLRIVCCAAYPALLEECVMTMAEVMPRRVTRFSRIGCIEVSSASRHWLCLFPQHGPGPKHLRPIVLADWQRLIVDKYPAPFIRGLIHSDGCRVLNWVNGTPYPRYHFSNASADIRALFGNACDLLGVQWRQNNARNLSVARRESVRLLDAFVGPKR